MRRQVLSYVLPWTRRQRALYALRSAGVLATSCYLLLSLTACSTATPPVLLRPNPPPPGLTLLCDEGPEPPKRGQGATLAELTHIVSGREKAAEQCRARHAGLVEWANTVSTRLD